MREDDSWAKAVELVADFCRRPARMAHLLERVPSGWDGGKRRACQSLLFGTVRHLRLLEKALNEFLQRRPKPRIRAALLVASWELLEQPERSAKIVHHAVEKVGAFAGKSGRGLANAVLRKVADRLPELLRFEAQTVPDLAWRYSHPDWMVRRWVEQFGGAEAKAFLEWNQEEAAVYARWQRDERALASLTPVEGAEGYFRLRSGGWEEIAPHVANGRLYIQNPAARLAPEFLARQVKTGRLLDLCAAPGGKSLLLETKAESGVADIVSVDLEGPRFERLKQNVERYAARRIRLVATDILEVEPGELGRFEGVLLDAPCSNSGVFQHKVDARWRLREEELAALVELQSRMLKRAAAFVAPRGVLVYSTCSVDREENEGVVESFLADGCGADFRLVDQALSRPWLDGQDGAGAFLLERVGV